MDVLEGGLGDPTYFVVDGMSTDRTREIAQSKGARIIQQTGKGKGQAVAQAFPLIPADAEYVVLTDGDYTYPATAIPEMFALMDSDPSIGMVTGNRFPQAFRLPSLNPSFYYYLGNRLLALAQYTLNGIRMRDPLTGLRVVRADLIRDWTPKSKGFAVEAELNHHIQNSGFKIREVLIDYRSRLGKKKLGVTSGFPILFRIIKQTLTRRHVAQPNRNIP
jgi:dolichol-phosphate mannosyltransferase